MNPTSNGPTEDSSQDLLHPPGSLRDRLAKRIAGETGAEPVCTAAEEWGEPVGRLDEALGAAGVAADDIGLVLLSHAHPDHIGGLTTGNESGRRLVFPRARHVISRTEFEYWTSDRVPAGFASMGDLARLHLKPIERAGMLDLVDGEQEVAPGIRVLPAPGHTPGHVAISISAGSQHAIFVGDAVLACVFLAGKATRGLRYEEVPCL